METNPSRPHCTTQPPAAGSQPSFPVLGMQKGLHDSPQSSVRSDPGLELLPEGPPFPPPGFLERRASGARSPLRPGPGPLTARGRRSSSRRRRSTGRRRCRRGGGRSSGPGSPSSRAGTRRRPPPPWPGRASREPTPGKVAGPHRSRGLAYCRGLRAAGPPPSGGAARSRRTKEGAASTRSLGGFTNPGGQARPLLGGGVGDPPPLLPPRGARSLVKKVQHGRVVGGRSGHRSPLLVSFPSAEAVKGRHARRHPVSLPRPSQGGVNSGTCGSHPAAGPHN